MTQLICFNETEHKLTPCKMYFADQIINIYQINSVYHSKNNSQLFSFINYKNICPPKKYTETEMFQTQ